MKLCRSFGRLRMNWIPISDGFLSSALIPVRVLEVCQLRTEDIFKVGEFWCIKFDPEPGSLKNQNSERAIPLHPAITEAGFLQFVKAAGSGPLFKKLTADRFGNRGGNGTEVIGKWVRGLGLTDERISPSHSWRHRFETMSRRHQLMPDIANAITGHYRKTVADSPCIGNFAKSRKSKLMGKSERNRDMRCNSLIVDP